MNLQQIRKGVQEIIQDESFSAEEITSVINDLYRWFMMETLNPGLKTVVPVQTIPGQNYIDLSYRNENISMVKKALYDGNPLEDYSSLESLLFSFDMTKEGRLCAYTVEGLTIWYVYMPPKPETVLLLCYKHPETLYRDKDIPVHIPDHLHTQTLVFGSAYMLYTSIEQDTELPKTNTSFYWNASVNKQNPDSGIQLLHTYMGTIRKPHISSMWRY